jgi:hypothetical protein
LWLGDGVRRRNALRNQSADEDPFVDSISVLLPLIEHVHDGSAKVHETVRALLSLREEAPRMAYDLPRLLAEIDERGLVVPELVAERIRLSRDEAELWCLFEVARHYPLGSARWRKIATAAFSQANVALGEREQVYSSIAEYGPTMWSSNAGEVPEHFVSAVAKAKQSRDEEQDAAFASFWNWRVVVTERALKAERERIKEE